MKAILLQQPGEFVDLEKQHPGKPMFDDVLLKIRRLSICGTDLHAFKGEQPFFTYPRILGHEIAAEVIEFGKNVKHLKIGDLCSVEPYRNKVIDQAVKRGKTTCGSHFTVLGVHEDGGMQEFMHYNAGHIHVANDLELDQLAVVEPFAIGSHAVERAEITKDDIVLVVGAGPIGIAVLTMAQLKGSSIFITDTNRKRLEFVEENFADVGIISYSENFIAEVQDRLNGDSPTIVMDATGNKDSMLKSFEYVAPGGTIVFVGLCQGDIVFNSPSFHSKELTLKATRAAKSEDFIKVIELMRTGKINIKGYISHRLQFDETVDNFTGLYSEENMMKAVIDF